MQEDELLSTIKQKSAFHLFYLLLTPLQLYTTTSSSSGNFQEEETNSFPIGLIIGPGLTAYNLLTAANANKKFKQELTTENLNGTVIKANSTVHGIISFKSADFKSLNISLE